MWQQHQWDTFYTENNRTMEVWDSVVRKPHTVMNLPLGDDAMLLFFSVPAESEIWRRNLERCKMRRAYPITRGRRRKRIKWEIWDLWDL